MEKRNNGRGRPVPRTGQRTAGGSLRPSISTGPNARPINETIAGTGPGLPDEALAPGEELPQPPSDEDVTRVERALGVHGKEDDLPLEGE